MRISSRVALEVGRLLSFPEVATNAALFQQGLESVSALLCNSAAKDDEEDEELDDMAQEFEVTAGTAGLPPNVSGDLLRFGECSLTVASGAFMVLEI